MLRQNKNDSCRYKAVLWPFHITMGMLNWNKILLIEFKYTKHPNSNSRRVVISFLFVTRKFWQKQQKTFSRLLLRRRSALSWTALQEKWAFLSLILKGRCRKLLLNIWQKIWPFWFGRSQVTRSIHCWKI